MKTNVTLNSTDRELFGVIIKQQTKNGKMLSVTDLQNAYNLARFQYAWSDRRISDIMKQKDFQERCYHLLSERNLIKTTIPAFMEMVENEGIVKVLKGLKVYKTSGRGNNKSTYCDPYIWVLLAMELNPLIYAKVVIWLTDSLIFNRVLAGTHFTPMTKAISKVIEKPNYPQYNRLINIKVFGYHKSGIRNECSQKDLEILSDIEKFICQSIDMGIIKTESHLFQVIDRYNVKKFTK